MFLAVRPLPQEWSSSVTSEIFGTKIIHYCGVEGFYIMKQTWQKISRRAAVVLVLAGVFFGSGQKRSSLH